MLFGRGEVAGKLIAIVDDNVRLQFEHHLIHLLGFPAGGIQRPGYVVPKHVDLAVVRQQFANLAVHIVHEPASRGFVVQAPRPIRMVPVHQRMIEAHAQSFPAHGLHEFFHQIAAAGLLGRAVVGVLSVEKAETFMVFGGHHHVFLARLFGQPRPGARGIRLGREALRQEFVFGNRDAFLFHGPFVASQFAVQSPVNEHAEARFVPPAHAPLAVRLLALRHGQCCAGAQQSQTIPSRYLHDVLPGWKRLYYPFAGVVII